MVTKRPYFPNLDVLRFFAAFFVLFGHCVTDGLSYLNLPYPLNNLLNVICSGRNWVSLFFVLSGFLLGYLAFFEKAKNIFSIKKFLIRRTLRIWPLYFLFVFIGYFLVPLIVKLLIGKIHVFTTLPYFLLFAGNFAMKQMYELNDFSYIPGSTSILWSVSIEEQFYIILGIFFLLFNIKHIKWLMLILSIGGLAYILMPKQAVDAFNFHTFYYLFDFFTGALLGSLAFQKIKLVKNVNQYAKFLGWIIVILFTVILLTGHIIQLKLLLVAWYLYLLIIIYLSFCRTSIVLELEKSNWLIYGGKISYGIYVIHLLFQYPIYLSLNKYLTNYSQFEKDMLCVILTSIFTFFLAHISFKYFEGYFLGLKNKFY